MNPKTYFLKPFTHFYRFLGEDATFKDSFKGRVARKEYWLYFLWYFIGAMLFGLIEGAIGFALYGDNMSEELSIFSNIFIWITCAPIFGLAWRRMHDVGKSGWMILISLIPIIGGIWLLVLFVNDGNPGENEHGANPKEMTV